MMDFNFKAEDTVWSPQVGAQTMAVLCPADVIFFGGARGGGKTDCALGRQIIGALTHEHNWNGLFLRKNFKHFADLRRRIDGLIRNGLPAVRVGGDNQTNTLRFNNGAKVLFTAIERPEQLEFFQGQSLTEVSCEEACQFSFVNEMIDKLKACLRSAAGVKCTMFLTGNPGGAGHCVPYGEVLTERGWVDIKDVQIGDMAYSVDAQDNLVLRRVTGLYAQHYEGDMFFVDTRGLHMACTPEHRVVKVGGTKKTSSSNGFVKKDSPLFSLVPFEDLPGQAYIKRHVANYEGVEIESFAPDYFKTRKRKLNQPIEVSGDHYCSFMGWFLSEGFARADGAIDPKNRSVGICQSKPDNRDIIKALLLEMGFVFSEQSHQFVISAPCWWNYLKQFGKCRDKFIPDEIKNASRRQMLLFLDAMMLGDGCWSKKGESGVYYTLSKRLADDLSEMLVKCGFVVCICRRNRESREGTSHEVYFKPAQKIGGQEILTGFHKYDVQTETKRSSDIKRERFSGGIYCIEVEETHNFVLRQKGSVWLSGNSAIKARFISPAPRGGVPLQDGDDTAIFIPSNVEDNRILCENDPKYVERLRSIRDPQLRRAWLEGDWDAVVGGFFDDVWEPRKHVIRDFRVPRHWPRLCGMDWGSSRPFSVGWYAVSGGEDLRPGFRIPRGALVRYDEWYGCVKGEPNTGLRLTSEQVAHGILEREKQRGEGDLLFDRIADTSIFDQTDGPSIGEKFADYGVVWRKADKRRLPGWERLRGDLRGVEVSEGNFTPMLYIADRCRYFVELLPTMQRDERNWEEMDSDGPDHCIDEPLHPDTLVHTSNGWEKISAIPSSGMVYTIGNKLTPYSNCRITNHDSALVELEFECGTIVKCSPTHEFPTNSGFIAAKDLQGHPVYVNVSQKQGDAICMDVQESRLNRKLVRSFWGKNTSSAGIIFSETGSGCTGLCGSISQGSRSRMDATSTMRIETGPITSTRTYALLRQRTIFHTTLGFGMKRCLKKRGRFLRLSLRSRPGLGMGLRMGTSGTENISRSVSEKSLPGGRKGFANLAARFMTQSPVRMPDFAATAASLSGAGMKDLTILKRPARSVGRFLLRTCMQRPSIAAESVVVRHHQELVLVESFLDTRRSASSAAKNTLEQRYRYSALSPASGSQESKKCVRVTNLEERSPVYCMSVPETEMFEIAGGVLTHNCRYVVMSRPGSGISHEEFKQQAEARAREIHDTVQDWEEIEGPPENPYLEYE